MDTPDWARPGVILGGSGQQMNMKLRDHIPQRGHIQLGSGNGSPKKARQLTDLPPETGLVQLREVQNLHHPVHPGNQNKPGIPGIIHEPEGGEPELHHRMGIRLQSGVQNKGHGGA
jgi:hypothetical protein